MPTCQLCLNDHPLRNSHIVPEFLYAELYNEKGHLMGINGRGNLGWKPLQQGIREPLFCESCEQHFNECFEKPSRAQWVVASPLPNPWDVAEPHWLTVDYESFKLFHLSVLYRAGVSTLPTFSEVSLGPHQEQLRQMLLKRDPGKYWQYPIFGLVLVNSSKHIVQMVTQGQQARFAGVRCYAIAYGGVQWWIGVSSQRSFEFERLSLQENGRMCFAAINWNELGVVKAASRLLRTASP